MCYVRNQKSKRLFMRCLVLAVIAAIVLCSFGQNSALAGAGGSTGPAEVGVTSVPEGGRIPVFNCEEDFGIRKALAMLGSMCNKNIVPSTSVDGQLAFRSLRDVTFEEAMDAILGETFVYEAKGNLIKVYTKEEYKKIKEAPERMIYKVFTLYYISATEAVKLITPVLSDTGNIQASSPAETVGTTGESITTGSGGGDTMALNDMIVIRDYPENIAEAEKLLKKLDIRPRQVLVEATILSATLSEGMELGVDLNLLGGVHLNGSEGAAADAYNSAVSSQTPIGQIGQLGQGSINGTPLEVSGFANAGGSGLRIGVTSGDLAAFITALEEVTDTTVLANPKILAVNKQLGQVYIGTKIGYESQTTQTQTSTTQQVEFLDTGTKLSFRPYIGDDGYIRMDIHPKDSSGTLKANDIPDEFSTELATNIIVKDGQTIVIGGLFRDVVVSTRSQIPLLGDLPLIGIAFRGTSETVTRQEVIVLLTPHIIDEPDEINSDARVDDVNRKRFGAKHELQWTSRARLAEDAYAQAAQLYIDGDNIGAMKKLQTALKLRPSYLEATRLKERIISESSPDEYQKLERVASESIDQQEASNWQRR
jgi:type IV pilus assembly protein PilQ